MRKITVLFIFAISVAAAYAGDVANFVNLGFSSDGTRFVFGQYGKTDVNYRAYADISCVDVAKDDFVRGGRFSTSPDASTSGKDGSGVFAALQTSASDFLKKQGIDSAQQGRALYVQAENEPNLKEISFKDFETGVSYHITLKSLSEGSGSGVRSSFYLIAEMVLADGKQISKTVGLPGLKRPGVSNYLVRRILTDNSGKSLIFIVEKTQYDKNGNSVRFMVETLRL